MNKSIEASKLLYQLDTQPVGDGVLREMLSKSLWGSATVALQDYREQLNRKITLLNNIELQLESLMEKSYGTTETK